MRLTWLAASLLLVPGFVHAAEPPTRSSAKRSVPDYGAPPAEDPPRGMLLPLKLVLTPPYFVWNYVVRKPLGALVSTAERNQWPTKVLDFFTFGPERNAGIVPTALFDFGIKPSVGVFAFWNKLGHPDHSASFHFGTWGPRWINVTAADRWRVGNESFVSVSGRWTTRPDTPFYGVGSRTLEEQRTRYSSRVREVAVGFDMTPRASAASALINEGADAPPSRAVRVLTRAGVRSVDFAEGSGDGDFDDADDFENPKNNDDMGLKRAIREGRMAEPPGFPQGYTNLFQRVELQLDSRPRRPAKQTGVRAVLSVEHGSDVRRREGGSWLRWGGSFGAYVDVGHNRTLGLIGTAMFADPLTGNVPFTEQVIFGGNEGMRGFWWNRLIARSGAIATLEYRWPAWVFIDGTVQLSVGNVFDAHLRNFSPKLLRVSGLVGVKTSNTPNQSFEALVGLGTETFADNLQVNSLRLVVGTSQF